MTVHFFGDCVILGQGKAGAALYAAFNGQGIRVSCVISKSRHKSNRRGPTPRVFESLAHWQQEKPNQAPTIFIAWPDGAVADAVTEIAALNIQPKAAVHLSGACGPEIWAPLKTRCPVGTFHPNAVLTRNGKIPMGIGVGIDASTDALRDALLDLAKRLNLGPVVSLKGVDRSAYHLAAVMVANLSLVLVQHGISLWTSLGFSKKESQRAMGNLLLTCAQRVAVAPPEDMLTGPVARGDLKTVQNHLNFLKRSSDNDDLLQTYALLSKQLLSLTNHDPKIQTALEDLFQGASDQSK